MATQTQVIRGYGIVFLGRSPEIRSRIGERFAEFKAQTAWGPNYHGWSNFIVSTTATGPTSQ